ncbi:alpha-glycosidase [Clostridium manihotivorum]|uniref:Alpha-glycosidase n=2 Tax=Clostridium manihotivorum TaxID=2320868 RepID=A0A3R5TI67_9CLOT|nr:alpha-glycosidase [Clostridium manihotivorum]
MKVKKIIRGDFMSMKESITKEAIYHLPKSNFSYGYDRETLHLRIRTKKGEVKKAFLRVGDPYIWEAGGADGGNLNAKGSVWSSAENFEMTKEAETEYFDYWFAEYKPPYKRSRYAFILENDSERLLFTERKIFNLPIGELGEDIEVLSNPMNFFCFPYLNGIDVANTPKWVKDTVWYQIFPDRFANGDHSIDPEDVVPWGTEPTSNNFMGGDLRGVIDKLDYLKDLGINGIYFCPIFTASANHRYDTIDYMEIDPSLGTKETFKELVEEAHKRGIKIMLDAVFNHAGFLSKQWQDVLKNEENSQYKDWFHIKKFPVKEGLVEGNINGKKLNYETFGTVFAMPKLDTENPEVKEYLLEVGRYWVREFDIDAWRLDVANEVDHSFWRDFRNELRKIKDDVYILGEIWHDSLPWVMGDQFDAVMNYKLTDGINGFFCEDTFNAEEFKHTVNQVLISYPRQVNEVNFNLLDSHDTSRILSIAKGNKAKAKLAYLFMFTQPGSPCIYYGDEIGLDGEKGHYSDLNRRCMIWEEEKQDKELYAFIKKLIELRAKTPEFKIIDIDWLEAGSATKFVAYRKGAVSVIINNSNEATAYKLPNDLRNTSVHDLYLDRATELEDEIILKPYEFRIFKK